MFNRFMNKMFNAYTSVQLKKYQHYPSATTAILLVNAQNAFLDGQEELKRELSHLLDMARKYQFLVVHAPFGGSKQTYPSPAQQKLTHLLQVSVNGASAPDELSLREHEIGLEPRSTLSAFHQTQLDHLLKAQEIEHLVVAGPYANLSLDSTVRDGVQLGYHLTVLNGCVSAEREEELKAFNVTMPRYAQTVIGLDKFEDIAKRSRIPT